MRSRRGSTMVEFTLAGIPVIFLVISTVEMARGMWLYHTVAFAAKTGARYAAVHGRGCRSAGNACGITVAGVAGRIAAAAAGLPPAGVAVTLTSPAGAVPCTPLTVCMDNHDAWPPPGADAPGMDLQVSVRHEFHSALSMFWPGQQSMHVGSVQFRADSRQRIQF